MACSQLGPRVLPKGRLRDVSLCRGWAQLRVHPPPAFTPTGPGFLFPSPLLDLCPNFPSLVSPPCSNITSPYNGR